MKILHVLEQSLPRLAGYTIRSKYIVENQMRLGIEPVVITSPLQGKTDRLLEDYEEIEGIKYYRTGIFNKLDQSLPLPVRLWQRYNYAKEYKKAIKKICEIEKPDIIHAHSSYLNGNRANLVARNINIPSIYEVRGIWGDTAVANENITANSWKYKFINYMDLKAMSDATRVVVISNLLKEDIVDRGINPGKITVVPNGIDTDHFVKQERDQRLVEKYGLQEKIVLGFIGSVRKIEGLDLLIKIMPQIVKAYSNCKIIIVGGGDELEYLEKLSGDLGVINDVILCGKVPHEDILKYYSLIDIFVYPRINSRVNHKVTPLKPLEAMSMEKTVIASNVGGQAELIMDDKTGLLFKVGSEKNLFEKIKLLLDNTEQMKKLGENGRKWVIEERDWEKVINKYLELYNDFIPLV